MKAKAGVNFHNRFDIEVNGKLVGYAENIILDTIYAQICHFQDYFLNIHFGTGMGTPVASRTTLFTHLGTKTAVTEEIVKAFPTSKWTRKITLNPEEFVGSTITEVGIAFGSTNTNLVTHAMIKDAEGNPLSITKTALDVIVIYASVFITFNTNDSELAFVDARTNYLLQRLLGESGGSDVITAGVGRSVDAWEIRLSDVTTGLTTTVTVDQVARQRKYKTRIPINIYNNAPITEIGMQYTCKKTIALERGVCTKQYQIGVGDGNTKKFSLKTYDEKSVIVMINGVPTAAYTKNTRNMKDHGPIRSLLSLVNNPNDIEVYDYINNAWQRKPTTGREFLEPGFNGVDISRIWNNELYIIPIKAGIDLVGKKITARSAKGYHYYSEYPPSIRIFSKRGAANPVLLGDIGAKSTAVYIYAKNEIILDHTPDALQIIIDRVSVPAGFSYIRLEQADQYSEIEFDIAPAVGQVITATIETPYYPKDENYVLDAEFIIQYGEG